MLFTLFGLIGIYLLMAILLSVIPTSPDEINCDTPVTGFVATNGVHLEIILPTESLSQSMLESFDLKPWAQYTSFGWGDRTFYLDTPEWSDLKFSTAINALFFTSETAIHLTYYSGTREHWIEMPLCDEQLQALLEYLDNTFARDTHGAIMEIPNSGYTSTDTFYEANGSYSFIKTCNSWVNSGLKRASVKTSIWSPFDKGVLYHLDE